MGSTLASGGRIWSGSADSRRSPNIWPTIISWARSCTRWVEVRAERRDRRDASGRNWRDVWPHQVRWARTIRVSKFAGYLGLPVTFATVWALVAACAGDGIWRWRCWRRAC